MAASTRRRKEWSGASSSALTGASAMTNNKKSALSAAYAELGKELTSGKLRTVGTYTLGRAIGEGTYGKVRLATHRLTGTRVAIKQVPKAHSATLTREIHHHRRLHHPNVMQLYEVLATESYIWMVTELCAGGELYDYLVERGTMPEPEARRIFGQLCLAVAYVHNRGIVHRDLKLENVLLDERCNVKLGDFGFTREFEGKKLMETFCGTTGYAAPEMLAGRRYAGEEVDVWSLGVILYALVCGALPFDDDDEAVMKAKILQGEYELPDVLSDECKDLITSILQQDPEARPTIRTILSHAWFTKVMGLVHMETVDEDAPDGIGGGQSTLVEGDEHKGSGLLIGESSALPVASPGPIAADDLAHKASASSISSTSFFSARSKSDSDASDRKSSDTGTTDPTTEEGDEEYVNMQGKPAFDTDDDAEGQTGCAPLSWKHRNESQTTIKRQTSSGSDTSRKAAPKSSSTPLPTHVETPSETAVHESDEQHSNSAPPILMMSVPLEQKASQSSSRAGGASAATSVSGHHRTPSRTKRRSSGGLSDHHPPSLDVRPVNYVAQLEDSSIALFSTVVEQNLLHQLSMLGLDVGQIVHSVVNEACDASGAMWWVLKKKAEEREQQHEADVHHSLWASLRDVPRSRKNSNSSQVLVPNSANITNTVSPTWPQRELVRPTAIKANTPQRVDAKTGPDAVAAMSAFKASVTDEDDEGVREKAESSSDTNALVEKPRRPVEQRTRASSFSARLTSVLAGKDKDLRKETGGEKASAIVDERSLGGAVERAKSPVIGSLFKKAPERASPAPTTPNKADKQKKKEARSPTQRESRTPVKLANDMSAQGSGDSAAGHSTPVKGGTTNKSGGVGVMHPTTSTETFSTVSSTSATGSPSTTKGAGKTSKAGFLHTVRNWLGAEEKKQASGTSASSGGKKKKKRRNAPVPVMSNTGTIKRAPSLRGGSALNSPHISRSGSVRRTHVAHNYHGAPLPRSPRVGHRGASISRRSSSGSVQYVTTSSSIIPQRPMSIRRQSAGSITPTATLAGADDYLHHVRGSRPSSAQSFHRGGTTSTLHARSGSTGSVKSFARIPSHESGYSGSLRAVHSRRTSIDGGTTVRRHRHYPAHSSATSTYHHAHVRSDSHSRSRPSSPAKYADESLGAHDLVTPRRSFDSYHGGGGGGGGGSVGGRASPMHTPRASQSVFVAHRSRTPYKPPSANPSLMRVADQEHTSSSSYEHSYGASAGAGAGAYIHGNGHRVPYGRMLSGYAGGGHLPLGTWHRSWGKPPPSWKGPIDEDVGGMTAAARAAAAAASSSSSSIGKPKLRDVFAVRESDDDWEDEEDEPTYAGGLGQLASSTWNTDQYDTGSVGVGGSSANALGIAARQTTGKSAATSNEAMPMIGGAIRSLFQAPSLGRETMPKTWITNDDTHTAAIESKDAATVQARSSPLLSNKPLSTANMGNATDVASLPATSSRVRSAAPTFKGPITIEEEEEDE